MTCNELLTCIVKRNRIQFHIVHIVFAMFTYENPLNILWCGVFIYSVVYPLYVIQPDVSAVTSCNEPSSHRCIDYLQRGWADGDQQHNCLDVHTGQNDHRDQTTTLQSLYKCHTGEIINHKPTLLFHTER